MGKRFVGYITVAWGNVQVEAPFVLSTEGLPISLLAVASFELLGLRELECVT